MVFQSAEFVFSVWTSSSVESAYSLCITVSPKVRIQGSQVEASGCILLIGKPCGNVDVEGEDQPQCPMWVCLHL